MESDTSLPGPGIRLDQANELAEALRNRRTERKSKIEEFAKIFLKYLEIYLGEKKFLIYIKDI